MSTAAVISFHYISSSDISADSRMMWAREKVRAEETLFETARGTKLRVIAYRPDYIGPTREESHLGQDVLYWFFAPVGDAYRRGHAGSDRARERVCKRRSPRNAQYCQVQRCLQAALRRSTLNRFSVIKLDAILVHYNASVARRG